MERIALTEICEKHIFHNVSGLLQVWNYGETFSFCGNPRPWHGFMYVLCDRVVFTEKNGTETIATNGDLIYIPKFSEYRAEFFADPDSIADLLVNFDISGLEGESYTFGNRIIRLFGDTSASIVDRMRAIGEASVNMNSPYLSVTENFYALISKIISRYAMQMEEDPKRRAISKAVLFIESHLSENTPVTELAKICLMSETQFRKAFRQYTGTSPAKYKTQKKIQKARSILLNSPEVSVNEVSDMLGFCEVSYFYKVFSDVTGTTPNRLRDK